MGGVFSSKIAIWGPENTELKVLRLKKLKQSIIYIYIYKITPFLNFLLRLGYTVLLLILSGPAFLAAGTFAVTTFIFLTGGEHSVRGWSDLVYCLCQLRVRGTLLETLPD